MNSGANGARNGQTDSSAGQAIAPALVLIVIMRSASFKLPLLLPTADD